MRSVYSTGNDTKITDKNNCTQKKCEETPRTIKYDEMNNNSYTRAMYELRSVIRKRLLLHSTSGGEEEEGENVLAEFYAIVSSRNLEAAATTPDRERKCDDSVFVPAVAARVW